MWESSRCVVLNSSYEPLSIVGAKKAIILCFEGKANILEKHPSFVVRSVSNSWPVPIQIILKSYVKARPAFRVPANLTPTNLYTRDLFTCQYCLRHRSKLKEGEFLTMDHVIARSKGGSNKWENVVTACSTCNNKKADYSLEDMGWKLSPNILHTPTLFEIWSKHDSRRLEE